jgi:hypothetical protein
MAVKRRCFCTAHGALHHFSLEMPQRNAYCAMQQTKE